MKRILWSLLAVTALFSCGPARESQADTLKKYMHTITASELKEHLQVIASDEMEGRNTGSEGQKKAGKYIISQYRKGKIQPARQNGDYYQHIPSEYFRKRARTPLPDSENIIAFIKGSSLPDEVVVISAHYDHIGTKNGQIYNGADDDGSGTVALMEIAEAFATAKKQGKGPKRSVMILHVTGEEHGLLGSEFYADNPVFPLSSTVANVNIDMIGRRDDPHAHTNNYIYLIGSDYLSSELHEICERMNQEHINLTLDYTFNDRNDPNRFYYRSDHYNFAKNNIPSVFLFSGVHQDYHQPGDDVDKIEFDALEKRAKLAFAIIWELANRDKRPVVDKSGN